MYLFKELKFEAEPVPPCTPLRLNSWREVPDACISESITVVGNPYLLEPSCVRVLGLGFGVDCCGRLKNGPKSAGSHPTLRLGSIVPSKGPKRLFEAATL